MHTRHYKSAAKSLDMLNLTGGIKGVFKLIGQFIPRPNFGDRLRGALDAQDADVGEAVVPFSFIQVVGGVGSFQRQFDVLGANVVRFEDAREGAVVVVRTNPDETADENNHQ